MTNKTLTRIGVGLFAAGLIILNLGFFGIFNLVGDCADGVASCSSYSSWQWVGRSGVIVLVIGSLVIAVSLMKKQKK